MDRVALLLACLLVPSWRWDRVPDADLVSYRVEMAYRDPNWYPCTLTGEDGQEIVGMCPAYLSPGSLSWTVADTPAQPADGETLCTEWDSGGPVGQLIPPLDSVLLINVRAVDAAGNVGQ